MNPAHTTKRKASKNLKEVCNSNSARKAYLGHVIRCLYTLLKAEKEGRKLLVRELLKESKTPTTTFYTTVRCALTEYGLVEFTPHEKANAVFVNLTIRGRILAETLYKLGIEP